MKKPIAPERNWVDIDGTKKPYQVNELGQVRTATQHGGWRMMHPRVRAGGGRVRSVVNVIRPDGTLHERSVAHLVADAFLGGVPEGCVIWHKNRASTDNEITNLEIIPEKEFYRRQRKFHRTVLKIDRSGEVVCIYGSVREAAKKEFISERSIYSRAKKRVSDEFSLTGYTYRYEED